MDTAKRQSMLRRKGIRSEMMPIENAISAAGHTVTLCRTSNCYNIIQHIGENVARAPSHRTIPSIPGIETDATATEAL